MSDAIDRIRATAKTLKFNDYPNLSAALEGAADQLSEAIGEWADLTMQLRHRAEVAEAEVERLKKEDK